MNQLPFSSVLSSRLFRFLVGPQKHEYNLHASLVAHQSPALNALVNGGLKEDHEQCVTLESVDNETFLRFAEYAYFGDYDTTALKPPSTTTDVVTSVIQKKAKSFDDEWNLNPAPKKKKGHLFDPIDYLSPQQKAFHKFKESLSYGLGLAPVSIEKNSDLMQDLTEIFLSHAKLYVLADFWGIKSLMQLTLHKLHQTLCKYELDHERTGDIIKLLRFCYTEGPDDLRDLVSAYAGCHLQKLWKAEGFQPLLVEFPDLCVILMGNLIQSLE